MIVQSYTRLSVTALAFAALAAASCNTDAYNRNAIIEFAETKASQPGFSTESFSGGSGGDIHRHFHGAFLVPFSEYVADNGDTVESEDLLWEVYQRYLAFIEDNVDFNRIPNLIESGRNTLPAPQAKRYDYFFESRDVSFRFDAAWFRGGPNDWENDLPAVEIQYSVRVN